jgi:hypothetical protein
LHNCFRCFSRYCLAMPKHIQAAIDCATFKRMAIVKKTSKLNGWWLNEKGQPSSNKQRGECHQESECNSIQKTGEDQCHQSGLQHDLEKKRTFLLNGSNTSSSACFTNKCYEHTEKRKAALYSSSESVEDTGHHHLYLTASDVTSYREVVQTPSSGMLRERGITLWKE